MQKIHMYFTTPAIRGGSEPGCWTKLSVGMLFLCPPLADELLRKIDPRMARNDSNVLGVSLLRSRLLCSPPSCIAHLTPSVCIICLPICSSVYPNLGTQFLKITILT